MPRAKLILDPNRPCPRGHIAQRYDNGRCYACIRARSRAWALANPERKRKSTNESARRVWKRDPEKAREKSRKDQRRRYARCPEVMRASNEKWKKENYQKVRDIHNRWRREHGRGDEVALRRANKKQATPAWADTKRIKEIYKRAKRLQNCLGVKMNVDHIVPLQSEFVCGLHVPWNLDIVTKLTNIHKGNKVWPDMTHWN